MVSDEALLRMLHRGLPLALAFCPFALARQATLLGFDGLDLGAIGERNREGAGDSPTRTYEMLPF
jgi:hypothetical protein